MAVALVTGASSGIGLATAITLARANYDVVATIRGTSASEGLRAAIVREGLPVEVVTLDVDDDISVRRTIERVAAIRGGIDVLVNNAGLGATGAVEDTGFDVFRQVMETNYFGALRCIKAVTPSMRTRRSGLIINVSSISGRMVMPGNAAYAASKYALEAMSEALAQELKSFDVRVAIVEPGVIMTPIFRKLPGAFGGGSDYPHARRLTAIYGASLKVGTSPFAVADQILAIAAGESWQLRYLVGADAERIVDWRQTFDDEAWIDFATQDDNDWARRVSAELGLPVTL